MAAQSVILPHVALGHDYSPIPLHIMRIVSPFQNCARKALDKFASLNMFFFRMRAVLMLRPDGSQLAWLLTMLAWS